MTLCLFSCIPPAVPLFARLRGAILPIVVDLIIKIAFVFRLAITPERAGLSKVGEIEFRPPPFGKHNFVGSKVSIYHIFEFLLVTIVFCLLIFIKYSAILCVSIFENVGLK